MNWPPYCTETLYGSQFALTIQLITLNYPVIYKVDIVHVLTKIKEKRECIPISQLALLLL